MESPDPFLLAAPSGRDETYPPGGQPNNGFIHELETARRDLVHDLRRLSTVHPRAMRVRHARTAIPTIETWRWIRSSTCSMPSSVPPSPTEAVRSSSSPARA